MGCDINGYIDTQWSEAYERDGKEYPPFWVCFSGSLSIRRNYELFTHLAGVRGPINKAVVPPRGVPDLMSWRVQSEFTLLVTDDPGEGECSAASADVWVKNGCSKEYSKEGGYTRITHPDWHTPSWLTVDEIETALSQMSQPSVDLKAVVAAMHALNEGDNSKSRFIFWFDS